ncbi:Crp/Fnr family transcriptional regulator [Mesobacterium sp. TK19101]|uniref:Crp/Fnr family transcriptional regulator n=1 Tax=Mesobacterium hydrothermale TaxID=3111907 RepID=A0ABU6HJA7_9RHOB|nr:Crp/Fnr family transcriptional regulator [Mesobacterium sp. TK19101]MEC3862549.1 Crp/Fnr family transcriptional regulator [Mesobacterium sp. TK19101]
MVWAASACLPGLDAATASTLDRLVPMAVPAGTALFHPGEEVTGFVVVLSGRVEVFLTGPSGRDILLYAVEPGQSCVQSTLGLLGDDCYSGEAIAKTDCRLVMIPRALFLDLMGRSAGFRGFVFSAFAQRMKSMTQLIEKVAFQRIEARLAEALLERSQDGTVTATHAELAVIIGSAREVVSRRLDALARRGMVRLERGSVQIRDADALRLLAES